MTSCASGWVARIKLARVEIKVPEEEELQCGFGGLRQVTQKIGHPGERTGVEAGARLCGGEEGGGGRGGDWWRKMERRRGYVETAMMFVSEQSCHYARSSDPEMRACVVMPPTRPDGTAVQVEQYVNLRLEPRQADTTQCTRRRLACQLIGPKFLRRRPSETVTPLLEFVGERPEFV